MKEKRLLKYIGAFAALGVLTASVCALPVFKTKTASAATLSSVDFKEDFSSKDLSDNWLKNDFEIAEDSYYSMRFDNQTAYGAAMLYTDYVVHGDCVISFDFYQSEVVAAKARDNWFGILFGYTDDSAHFTGGNAAILCYGRGQTQLMDDGDGKSETLVADSYNDHTKYSNSFNKEENSLYTVELVVSYTGTRYSDGENLYQIDGYYYEKGGMRIDEPQFSYKGIAADGYFGFSAMSSAVLDVSNLQIHEGANRAVYEDFEQANGSGKKLLPNAENSVWRGINLSEVKVYSYFNGRIDASTQANGLLLSDYELEVDTLNAKTFDISFEATFEELAENSGFGVALGLTSNAASTDEGTLIGLKGLPENKFQFVHIKDGVLVAQTGAIPVQILVNGKNHVELIGYYDGSVHVKVGGYTAAFDDAVENGFVGLATFGDESGRVFFDNVQVIRNSYVSANAPNHAINFMGVKETVEDDFTYVERYVNEKIWYLGSGVAFPKVFNATPYIQFTDSNERSCFGAKQTYSEFICRFSITVTQNRADAMGQYIGLSFGKENRNDYAVDSPSILFGSTTDGMILQGYNCNLVGADSNGVINQYESYQELDFWSAENWRERAVTYRVMMVVRGGNAYLYYANEADMSEMNVCKAVATDVATSGYVTVSGLNGATFRLKDFSITNIALQGKTETIGIAANTTDSEYVNVDFNDSALYSVTGDAVDLEKGISLGYSSAVKINEKYTDFLAYIDVNDVAGNGVEVKIGENFVRFNADGSIYSDMSKISGAGLFDFSALKNGGVVMMEAIGGKLSIGVVGSTQPDALLEKPIAVYEFNEQETPVEISVATLTETVLSLQSVRLYTLKPTILIEADNWDAQDTELPEKDLQSKTEETKKSVCSGVISFSMILPMVATVGVLLYKKRGEQDE